MSNRTRTLHGLTAVEDLEVLGDNDITLAHTTWQFDTTTGLFYDYDNGYGVYYDQDVLNNKSKILAAIKFKDQLYNDVLTGPELRNNFRILPAGVGDNADGTVSVIQYYGDSYNFCNEGESCNLVFVIRK